MRSAKLSVNGEKVYNLWCDNDVKWVHVGVDKEGGGILTTWHNKNFN